MREYWALTREADKHGIVAGRVSRAVEPGRPARRKNRATTKTQEISNVLLVSTVLPGGGTRAL